MDKKPIKTSIITAVSFIALVLCIGLIQYQNYNLKSLVAEQDTRIKSVEDRMKMISGDVSILANQGQDFVQKLSITQETSNEVKQEIGKVTQTIGSLDKLAKTDPQLLQKYSKVYFLNEHYEPKSLSIIESQYTVDTNRTYQFHAQALPYLVRLIDSAKRENLNILVASSYRSFNSQAALKSAYKITYGTTKANSFSADQGYSEHQLGTTIDFSTKTLGANFYPFDKTAEYTWLLNHAHEYGFVISYPKSNSYYIYEPWHWRYVGVELATKIHNEGRFFYDYDQRTISDYLAKLFD